MLNDLAYFLNGVSLMFFLMAAIRGDNTPEDVDAFLDRFEDGMKHLQKIRK